ncbi:MAG: hypothetical protein CMO78_03530 [Verrucomicrobiales bacterium]|nr:hypothetical protein [Verrucomicrobiales bacterium]HCU86901.1 hypothetical protein [Verrucomicrobiales bacterium]
MRITQTELIDQQPKHHGLHIRHIFKIGRGIKIPTTVMTIVLENQIHRAYAICVRTILRLKEVI